MTLARRRQSGVQRQEVIALEMELARACQSSWWARSGKNNVELNWIAGELSELRVGGGDDDDDDDEEAAHFTRAARM